MPEKHYFVRTCIRNDVGQLVSPSLYAKGFIWPEEVGSVVTCPDWDPDPFSGHGLHGLRPGDQETGEWVTGPNAVWMVCSYDPETAVEYGTVKVPSCVVEYVVDLKDGAPAKVTSWLRNRGVAEPIYRGESVVGDNSVAMAGDYGVAVAGDMGHAIAGYDGKATAGRRGHATTSHYGKSVAGVSGVAISGSNGTSIAGPHGHALTGARGHVQAGSGGTIQIAWEKPKYQRGGFILGCIGENGLEPDTLYKLDVNNNFVKVYP